MDDKQDPQNSPTLDTQPSGQPDTPNDSQSFTDRPPERDAPYAFDGEAENTSSAATQQPTDTPSPVSKKKKLLLGILIAVALLIGGLALAYVYWFQHPNKVVNDGLAHAFNSESLTYTGAVTTVGPTKLNVAIDGGGSTQGMTVNAKFAFDARDRKYTFDGSGLVDNKNDLYLKLKNIDGLVANYRGAIPVDSQPLFDQIIAKINDKWVKVGSDDVKNTSPDLAAAQKCTTDAIKKIQGDKAVKSELASVYKKHPFIQVEKTLGAKDGSLGYVLKSNDETAKAFLKEYKNTSLYKSMKECDDSYTINEDDALKRADDKENAAKVEVWIHRWTHQITRVMVTTESDGTTTNVSVNPKFNQPVTITTPKNSTTLEQLQKDVQSLLLAPQPAPASGTVPQQPTPSTES